MQYFNKLNTASRAEPLDCHRLTLSGTQPRLERLFVDRYAALARKGAFKPENRHARLADRRPVDMKPSTTIWTPEAKGRKSVEKRPVYDHPGLTDTQRAFMTAYTKGEG